MICFMFWKSYFVGRGYRRFVLKVWGYRGKWRFCLGLWEGFYLGCVWEVEGFRDRLDGVGV